MCMCVSAYGSVRVNDRRKLNFLSILDFYYVDAADDCAVLLYCAFDEAEN